ncbi:ATPase domain-containing protein [Halorhabdus amylolytica]|uniref:ATPase domain-containing protein n=1 Tax=Halorhabdus amylolytica TaxID=2559573 RepID=UPI0010AAF5F4|nr:ATPase domain-containing protein [Halorhabdus amylolytica]
MTDPVDEEADTDGAGSPDGTAEAAGIQRCDYCRLPIPHEPTVLNRDEETYRFCSRACRRAVENSDRVFTQFQEARRFDPGVEALQTALPEGMPRNSFVMLGDLAGTRTESVQAELVWRTLQRGEPAVVVAFLEPPVSIIQSFISLEWNVLPYLERDQLHVVDGFTYRVDDPERMHDRMSEWNRHLRSVANDATTTVRDATEIHELENRLDNALERLEMDERGIVVIDSLTELGSIVQPIRAYNFVKDVRADVCKGRFVPVFAGATMAGDGGGFPHDLGYMADGIVEMRLNEEIVEDALIKQIRVRKMSGVLTYPEWSAYEYTSGTGIVLFDPKEEMADSRQENLDAFEIEDSPADDEVLAEEMDRLEEAGASEMTDGEDGEG